MGDLHSTAWPVNQSIPQQASPPRHALGHPRPTLPSTGVIAHQQKAGRWTPQHVWGNSGAPEKPWSEQLRPHVLPSFSFGRGSKKTLLLGRLLSSRPLSERRACERRSSSPARGSMRSCDAPQRSDGGPEALNNGLGGVLAMRGREPFLLFEVHISR